MCAQYAEAYTPPLPIEGPRIEDKKDGAEALGPTLWSEQPAEGCTPPQPKEGQQSGDQRYSAEALVPTSRVCAARGGFHTTTTPQPTEGQ